MLISGSVGYVYLEKDNKKVLILSDIHDGPEYCTSDSIMIQDFLKMKSITNYTLLEEATPEKRDKLKPLWTGSTHTMGLRDLVIKDKNIIPVDIRPLLLPFSWELMNQKETYKLIKLHEYLILVDYFFKGHGLVWKKYIEPYISKMDLKEKEKLISHLQDICNIYKQFIKDNPNNKIEYYYNNKTSKLKELNDIVSYIMEWYSLFLILNNPKNSMIHLGLAHSERLVFNLNQIYEYNIIEQQGVVKMKQINDNIKACINVDTLNNKFNKKYSLYY